MTKQELSQLFYLNREIEQLEKQLDDLNRALDKADKKTFDSVKGSTPSFPYILHSIKLEGYSEDTSSPDMIKVMRLKAEMADIAKLIQINKEKCVYEYNRLCRYISEVEDSQIRQILMLRYINGLSWHKVAVKIGAFDESVPRKKHNIFLKQSEISEKKGS